MNLTSDELIAIHAEQRAKERYGIELSELDRDDMVSQVKDGRGLFFKKKDGSSKVAIWLVWWKAAARIVPIYYKAGRVLTVLPIDAFFGPAPQSNVVGGEVYATAPIVLTEWERIRLSQHVASNALTYMGHHARGGLRPHEIEEMERWNALSDKLKAALTTEGQP